VSPPRRHTFRVSTPGSRGPLRTDVAKRRFMFRPRGFTPPQRFPPRESYGSVAPRNRPRVRRVSCVPPPHRPKAGKRRDNPRDAVHTLRRFSLISSRTASLRPLPSCRYRPARRGPRREPVSLPTASPTEVGERTPALTLPGVTDLTYPRRGRQSGFPNETSAADLGETGAWAPKSSAGPAPVGGCYRCSEELQLRHSRVRRCSRLSEECRLRDHG
jgi:hypothetical protein